MKEDEKIKKNVSFNLPSENIFPISPDNIYLGDMDVESTLPMPGKGRKFIFKAIINSREINVIIDCGSSTTIVSKKLVIDLDL